MTSSSDEKWQPFNGFLSRVGLRTYQHPCTYVQIQKLSNTGDYKYMNIRFHTWRQNYLCANFKTISGFEFMWQQ